MGGRRAPRGKSFPTKALAERFRSELLIARDRGEQFDRATGSPLSWAPSAADQTLWEWSRKWVAQQWEEWQPRTRVSITEALSRFVPLAIRDGAPDPPDGIRQHVAIELVPGVAAPDRREPDQACDRPAHPWPPPPPGRSRRKAVKNKPRLDVRRLPDPATMRRAIEAIRTHQPASQRYQVMTAVAYYAGLRPSEVVMLKTTALTLPLSARRSWPPFAGSNRSTLPRRGT